MEKDPNISKAQGQRRIVNDFEIYLDQIIGEGTWGNVYLGRQLSLDREVAVKILKKECCDDAEFVQRFIREAKCLAQLVDENIIQVYGAGQYEKAYYFAMEFVHGLTLQKFIEMERHFSMDEIIHIGLSVAKALKTAWESPAKIIHRDIKPANIMIAFPASAFPSGRVEDSVTALKQAPITEAHIKVMDFGLAKAIIIDKFVTRTGTIFGSPKYIAPELALGDPVDIRADIYALGIILYELATGSPPFLSHNVAEMLNLHIYQVPPAPAQLNPFVPLGLDEVIMRCLKKRPADRYSEPAQLIKALALAKQPGAMFLKDMPEAAASDKTPTDPAVRQKAQLREINQSACELFQKHRFQETVDKARQCFALAPDYLPAKVLIEQAEKIILEIAELGKKAKKLSGHKKYEKSIAVYKTILELDPDNAKAKEGIKENQMALKKESSAK